MSVELQSAKQVRILFWATEHASPLRNVSIPARLTKKIMKPVDEQKGHFTAIILSAS